MFMGLELKVSPKVDSKIVTDKKLRHAFGSHKFPVVNEKELMTIGISIQPGWKIPIGQPDSKTFIHGPPKLNVQTPWYKTATAADGFNEAITDAPARVPIMEKTAKMCMDPKVVAFFSTFSDPTYPEETDGMARVLYPVLSLTNGGWSRRHMQSLQHLEAPPDCCMTAFSSKNASLSSLSSLSFLYPYT